LNGVNAEVYVSREKTEQANMRFLKVRKEEQSLVVDSGLLDNSTLLRDYEKTHFEVMSLKEEKRKLTRELQNSTREIRDIRDKIDDMKTHFPDICAHKLELEKEKRKGRKKKEKLYHYVSPYKIT
jgi:chromosome segregation ATPase